MALDMNRNQVGSKRPVIVGMALDDPNSPGPSEDLILATASLENMDLTLIESGVDQKYVDVLNVNDKIFQLRTLEDAGNMVIPDALRPDPSPEGPSIPDESGDEEI